MTSRILVSLAVVIACGIALANVLQPPKTETWAKCPVLPRTTEELSAWNKDINAVFVSPEGIRSPAYLVFATDVVCYPSGFNDELATFFVKNGGRLSIDELIRTIKQAKESGTSEEFLAYIAERLGEAQTEMTRGVE